MPVDGWEIQPPGKGQEGRDPDKSREVNCLARKAEVNLSSFHGDFAVTREGNQVQITSSYVIRCSPVAPCQSCQYGTTSRVARPSIHGDSLLDDLLEVLRSLHEQDAYSLLELIRGNAPFDQIRGSINHALSRVRAQSDDEGSFRRLQAIQHSMEAYSRVPPFRPRIMDLRLLGHHAPYRVPASPWTSVTDDDDLVSHLVSLYFTWDYPFYAFLDRRVLVKNLVVGNVSSDFCSPFLVNALLANACHYSQYYSEAYAVPGDIKTMGTKFLAVAEQLLQTHQFESGTNVRLASLQATLLLYERYSMSGEDDHGYSMLHRATEMAEALGIINSPQLNLDESRMSEDMITSIKRTAWGLFQIDTVVHANFLRPSRVFEVSVIPIDRETDTTDIWTPYPISQPARASWLSQYFDEACRLSVIARDISRGLQAHSDPDPDLRPHKRALYDRLRRWEEELPPAFAPAKKPASHILILRMRYHALLINLLLNGLGGSLPFHPSHLQEPRGRFDTTASTEAWDTALSSAREIAGLVRLHREEYGIVRAHPYTMYTIMLALFTLLEHPSFELLDRDFLSLTSSLSVVASCSRVGKNLWRIFRQSVRARVRDQQVDGADGVSSERSLSRSSSLSTDRWAHYAEALRKLADNDGSEESPSNYVATSIGDMLGMFETLSLGNQEDIQARQESSAFRFSPS
ncbi:transcription factor domain-containing protein [Aspergillus affinis]|uniref:transcription factor domain-containing protein n=1 Tax=Aspergillus affinis TaxID=1070780 RepID=UPI0022FE6CB5|nr:pathway-specific regulatory protein [Aspergillus affinis]KAI9035129.1 pathway-specific regulatory protein [Aspergillus affinis]